jgi:hypothetical protein
MIATCSAQCDQWEIVSAHNVVGYYSNGFTQLLKWQFEKQLKKTLQ